MSDVKGRLMTEEEFIDLCSRCDQMALEMAIIAGHLHRGRVELMKSPTHVLHSMTNLAIWCIQISGSVLRQVDAKLAEERKTRFEKLVEEKTSNENKKQM